MSRKVHPRASMRRRKKLFVLVFVFCVGICATPNLAYAQEGRAGLPDSPSESSRAKHGNEVDREVSWKSLPKDFLQDQKNIWLFPTQLAKGHHWPPTLFIAGGTAGLIVADPHVMPYFRDHARNLDDINDVFDAPITTGEVIAVPASLLIAGYVRHDTYQVSTALLAGEAYADSAVVDLAIKAVTRRKRPSDVRAGQSFNDTLFSGGAAPFHPVTPRVFFLWQQWLPRATAITAGCHGYRMLLQRPSAFLA
jgi:hypothetical protein